MMFSLERMGELKYDVLNLDTQHLACRMKRFKFHHLTTLLNTRLKKESSNWLLPPKIPSVPHLVNPPFPLVPMLTKLQKCILKLLETTTMLAAHQNKQKGLNRQKI